MVEDGATSLFDLDLRRFFAERVDLDTPEERTIYDYVFCNGHPRRSHWVVPLFPLFKKVQHGMHVEDATGAALVQLPAAVCIEVSVRHAQLLIDDLAGAVRDVFDLEVNIAEAQLRETILGATRSKAVLDAQAAAIQILREECTAWWSRAGAYVVDILAVRDDWPPIYAGHRGRLLDGWLELSAEDKLRRIAEEKEVDGEHFIRETAELFPADSNEAMKFNRLGDAFAAAVRLHGFLQIHRTEFVPYAVLRTPLAPATTEECSFAFVRHTVRKSQRRRNWKAYWGELLHRIARARYNIRVDFRLNRYAESSHFRIRAAHGIRIDYDECRPGPANYPFGSFLADNHHNADDMRDGGEPVNPAEFHLIGPPWEEQEEQAYTFYRRKRIVRDYRKSIRHALQEASPSNGDRPTQGRIELTVMMLGRENRSVIGLSAATMVMAILAAAAHLFGQPGESSSFVEATVAMALTLGLFSYDKPVLRDVIALRILGAFLVVFLAIAFGWVDGPTWAKLLILGLPAVLYLAAWVGSRCTDPWRDVLKDRIPEEANGDKDGKESG